MSAFGGKADMRRQGAKSAFDPKRTSASIFCCSSEGGFGLYQSAHLSRYDALFRRGATTADYATESALDPKTADAQRLS